MKIKEQEVDRDNIIEKVKEELRKMKIIPDYTQIENAVGITLSFLEKDLTAIEYEDLLLEQQEQMWYATKNK